MGIIKFDDDTNEAITAQKNVMITNHYSYEEESAFDEYKNIPRDIKEKTEDRSFSLNMVTLRVTNEISMLLHRNFNESTSDFLQRKRLGSWWYSAIKNHKYSGIAMQNNIKITIIYDDDQSPEQKIENKIELVSGLFYTKINFKDEKLQITFLRNDFEKYLKGKVTTKNPYFENVDHHMIQYKNINQIKKQKCSTEKNFEYV